MASCFDYYCLVSGNENLTSQMQNLTIKIDNVVYTLPPDTYTSCYFSTPEEGHCQILITYEEELGDQIYIGLPFFENFVTAYDYSKGTVKLGLNLNASKGAAINVLPDIDGTTKGLSGWMIFAIIVISFVVLVLVIACSCYIRHRLIKRNESQ